MSAYYNEIEPFAADWLRKLIAAGHLPEGEVDTRSIVDVSPDDLKGFTQCHFFAGIGGWPHALRLAGWPDDRPVWTGSCPCQPFSIAGKRAREADERHLWPEFSRLIRAKRPPVIFGEQVGGSDGVQWAQQVAHDFEEDNYRVGVLLLSATAFGASQRRERIYFAADTALADAGGRPANVRWNGRVQSVEASAWSPPPWESRDADLGFVDDGLPASLVKSVLRGFGNAIIPQAAAEVIGAYLDAE